MKAVFSGMSKKSLKHYFSHDHTQWEITALLCGQASVIAGNKVFYLKEGDVIVLPPYTMHEGNSEVLFSDISVGVENLDFSDVFVVNDSDGSIRTLMKMIYKVQLEKEENHVMIADSLSEALVQYIIKLRKDSRKYPFVQQLKDDIYRHFNDADFVLSEAIDKTGFNSDYIRRCFKEETEKTPLEYLTHLRLEYAKGLLTRSDYISIEDVSEKCGFNDSFYFSTCFKKHTGMSPLKYRKKSV